MSATTIAAATRTETVGPSAIGCPMPRVPCLMQPFRRVPRCSVPTFALVQAAASNSRTVNEVKADRGFLVLVLDYLFWPLPRNLPALAVAETAGSSHNHDTI